MSELTAGEILRNQWKDGPRHHEAELLDRIAGELFVKYRTAYLDACVRGVQHPNLPSTSANEDAVAALDNAAAYIDARRARAQEAGGE